MKILISCKNLEEALILNRYNVDIIDVKNPEEGSLGACFPWIIKSIRNKIKDREISATVGDLDFKPGTYSLAAYCLKLLDVDYIKAGMKVNKNDAEKLVENLREATKGKKLVICAYADYKHFGYVSPHELIDIAYDYEADGIMIDTLDKKKGRLFDNLTKEYLKDIVKRARKKDLLIAIAGGLGLEDAGVLKELNPDVVGFRTAVCDKRNGNIVEEKLLKLIKVYK